MDNYKAKYEQFKAKYKVLEEENILLSERAEDILLLSLVSESITNFNHKYKLIDNVLERISILKEIPFCACCKALDNNSLEILGKYFLYDNIHKNNISIEVSEKVLTTLKKKNSCLIQNPDQTDISIIFKDYNFNYKNVLLVCIEGDWIKTGFFVFADVDKQSRFDNMLVLLKQIAQISSDKLDRIYLFDELKKLNKNLENKVEERTYELNELNQKLEEEIADRVAVQDALEISEEKYRELFQMANDAIYLWELDEDNNYKQLLDANRLASKMSGYTKNELLKLLPQDLDSENELKNSKKILQKILKKGRIKFEIEHKTKLGNIIPVEISSHLFKLHEKKVILAITRDISQRKLAELKLKEYNQELLQKNSELIKAKERAEESDRLKSAFLANISHEIRTPLNGIIGFSSLLGNKVNEEQKKSYINIIHKSSDQLIRIIDDILDISKIEANQLRLNIQAVNINNLIDELYTFYINYKPKKLNEIQLISKKELPSDSFILGDYNRLVQVFSNLLRNAFDYTEKGFIKFGYSIKNQKNEGKLIEFFVEDTGIGIKPEQKNIIFERFRQVQTDENKVTSGTGLGLSISKGIVQLWGGEMSIESTFGKGSVFYFTIPYIMNNGNEFQSIDAVTIESGNQWNDKQILVIEDEEFNYQLLEIMLQETGAKLYRAKTGQSALSEIMQNQGIDFVLLDIRLPDISGHDLAKKIRKLRPSLPIVAQSAYALEEEKQKALAAGCNNYITKPIFKNVLLKMMQQYLS